MVVKKSVLRLTIFGGRPLGRVYWILMVHCPESEILVSRLRELCFGDMCISLPLPPSFDRKVATSYIKLQDLK